MNEREKRNLSQRCMNPNVKTHFSAWNVVVCSRAKPQHGPQQERLEIRFIVSVLPFTGNLKWFHVLLSNPATLVLWTCEICIFRSQEMKLEESTASSTSAPGPWDPQAPFWTCLPVLPSPKYTVQQRKVTTNTGNIFYWGDIPELCVVPDGIVPSF